MIKLFLSFDLDYEKDYEFLPKIFKTIGNTPCVLFITGHSHPANPISNLPRTCILGNHSFNHGEWFETPLKERLMDLMDNHNFIRQTYGVDCEVYRSPHLRNFPDTADWMEEQGYRREMECAECSVCQPMEHAHLKQYFSSHHHFRSSCNLSFVENFEAICKKGKDFTFFLDPHDFIDERLKYLKEIIKIGKTYGEWKHL